MNKIKTKFTNMKVHRGTEQIVKVIEKYFDRHTISMGAFVRKMPYLLMDLAYTTKDKWCAFGLSSDNGFTIILGIKKDNDEFDHEDHMILIDIIPTTKSGIRTSMRTINNVFNKDKWMPYKVTDAKMVFETKVGTFHYQKSRLFKNNELFSFSVSYDQLGFIRRISKTFLCQEVNESNKLDILKYHISSVTKS